MLSTLVMIGTVVVTLSVTLTLRVFTRPTIWGFLQLFGAVCLLIMVFTHVTERFRWFPAMGWGLRNSFGHYLDLISALSGLALLGFGSAGGLIAKVRTQTSFH
jgi:uncharacterized membrane protein